MLLEANKVFLKGVRSGQTGLRLAVTRVLSRISPLDLSDYPPAYLNLHSFNQGLVQDDKVPMAVPGIPLSQSKVDRPVLTLSPVTSYLGRQ